MWCIKVKHYILSICAHIIPTAMFGHIPVKRQSRNAMGEKVLPTVCQSKVHFHTIVQSACVCDSRLIDTPPEHTRKCACIDVSEKRNAYASIIPSTICPLRNVCTQSLRSTDSRRTWCDGKARRAFCVKSRFAFTIRAFLTGAWVCIWW